MKRVVILQPGYLPWLGFFDLMHKSHAFVILDDVQYTVRDWRSRNRIKTPDGVCWLTVPVKIKGSHNKLVKDIQIDNSQEWRKKHLRTLESYYKHARYFDEVSEMMNRILGRNHQFLIDLDMMLIHGICDYLALETEIMFSSEISSSYSKDEKLLSICKHLEATHYLSGNAAEHYLRESIFGAEKITVEWHNYQHPYYDQLWLKEQGFISHLSAADLLFNHGRASLDILTGKQLIFPGEGVLVTRADEKKQVPGTLNGSIEACSSSVPAGR